MINHSEELITILFLTHTILSGICLGLWSSRNYWRRKWEQNEEIILEWNIKNDK